ncbi:hypothetical protein HF325_003573 [Metschnikowia pulcherrima]|uniref:Uncharacterized protein n=1 Tax=Metschnikowia pulcherrima TaxID=27326 RepID=A0A8H7LCA8_9ASCO|nr:hypothetical protein HF325_003573 [Metschnikowia pulcherrima]
MVALTTGHVLIAALICCFIICFHFRVRIIEKFEFWRNRRRWHSLSQSPGSGFQDDMEAGLSSSNFDLHENLLNQDPRSLDESAKEEIRNLMLQENISFDKARLKYFQDRLLSNGIGADGIPKDSKTVTF